MEGYNMTSQAGHHGEGSQLYPNQEDQCSVKIKAARNVFSRLRALFQIRSSICFCKKLLFLYTTAFILIYARGEEQTRICKLLDPAIIWDRSSVANFEMLGLCPCSSTQQFPMKWVNICIPHFHLNIENHSPDLLGCLICSRANVQVVVVTVLAIIGLVGLAGWLYKRRHTFTEADINRGLVSEPAVARQSNPTFEILPSID